MSDIDRIGIERTMQEALDRVAGPGFVHVSLDLDALDPEVAPGVGTPCAAASPTGRLISPAS